MVFPEENSTTSHHNTSFAPTIRIPEWKHIFQTRAGQHLIPLRAATHKFTLHGNEYRCTWIHYLHSGASGSSTTISATSFVLLRTQPTVAAKLCGARSSGGVTSIGKC